MSYTPTVTIGGVDRSTSVRIDPSLQIEDTRSDTPATCTFTVHRPIGWLPSCGQAVVVTLDARTLFQGQIQSMEQTYESLYTEHVFRINCTDYGKLADSELVTGSYTATAADTIATALLPSGFTGTGIEASLDPVTLSYTNERRSSVLTRLANAVGGQWYWAGTDLHFFVTTPEAGIEQPDSVTGTQVLNATVSDSIDYTQVCNRVYVDGKSTYLLAPLSASATLAAVAGFDIVDPVSTTGRHAATMDGFSTSGGRVRMTSPYGGTPVDMTYTGISDPGDDWATGNASAGANSVAIGTGMGGIFPSGGGWARAANGVIFSYTSRSGDSLLGVPTTQSLANVTGTAGLVSDYTCQFRTLVDHPFAVGDFVTVTGVTPTGYNGTWQVTNVPTSKTLYVEVQDPTLAASTSGGWIGFVGQVSATISAGTAIWPCPLLTGLSGAANLPTSSAVQAVAVVEDTAAQTALAAIMGGTGIREDRIDGSSLTGAEATTRGQAELQVRAYGEHRLRYVTTDPKTRGGTVVTVALYKPTYAEEVLADTPVAYYALNDAAGAATAVDSSGNSHTATVVSSGHASYFGQTGCFPDATTSLILDGDGDYLTCAHHADFNVGNNLSIEAFVNPAVAASTQTILGKGAGTFALVFDASTRLFYLRKADTGDMVRSSTSINSTGWHHVVATKWGSLNKIYVDGQDVSVVIADYTLVDNSSTLELGTRLDAGPGLYYCGGIQRVALYPSALSAARVLAHYTASKFPPAIAGTYKVQRVTMTDFGRGPTMAPSYRVEASDRRFTPISLWKQLQKVSGT
jgi:hypothetical protein